MQHLTFNDYITAKALIRELNEKYHIVEAIKERQVYSRVGKRLRADGLVYLSGATKGVIYDEETLDNWVIKFDLDDTDSYCETEYRNYRDAVRDGFDCYLATSKKILTIDNISFYLAEYIECDESEVESTFTNTLMDSGCFDCEEDASSCIDCNDDYDQVMLAFGDDSFAYWISNHNINDLHCGNFGKRADGSLVIVDYSGF